MRRLIIVLFLLLLSGAVSGVDYIEDTNKVTIQTASWAFYLGIPRQQIVLSDLDSSKVWIWDDARSTNDDLIMSYDGGATVADYHVLVDHDHTHLNIYKDTVFVGNGPGGAGNTWTVYDNSGTITTAQSKTDWGTDGYSATIMSQGRLPGSDTILLLMHDDGSNSDAGLWFYSTDDGANWADSTSGGGRLYNNGGSNERAGIIVGETTDYAVWDSSGAGHIRVWSFDRGANDWSNEGYALQGESGARSFAMTEAWDSTMFVVSGKPMLSTNLRIHYATKTKDVGSWLEDSITIGSGYSSAGTLLMTLGLSYIESSQRVVLTYGRYVNGYNTTNDSIAIFCRYWKKGESTWSSEFRISTDATYAYEDISTAHRTPSIWGDQNFFLCVGNTSANIDGFLYNVIWVDNAPSVIVRGNVTVQGGVTIK